MNSKLLPGERLRFAGVLGESVAELKLKFCSSSRLVVINRGDSEAIVYENMSTNGLH